LTKFPKISPNTTEQIFPRLGGPIRAAHCRRVQPNQHIVARTEQDVGTRFFKYLSQKYPLNAWRHHVQKATPRRTPRVNMQKRFAHENVISAACYPAQFKNAPILAHDSLNGTLKSPLIEIRASSVTAKIPARIQSVLISDRFILGIYEFWCLHASFPSNFGQDQICLLNCSRLAPARFRHDAEFRSSSENNIVTRKKFCLGFFRFLLGGFAVNSVDPDRIGKRGKPIK
jgi:hypothetical protein